MGAGGAPLLWWLPGSGGDKHRSPIYLHGKTQHRTKVQFNEDNADAAHMPILTWECFVEIHNLHWLNVFPREYNGDCTGQKADISRFYPEHNWKQLPC